MTEHTDLVPLLVVRDAARAIDFYVTALGAEVVRRFEHGSLRHVSHADLRAGALDFAVTEEVPTWNSHAPVALGGSPVVLQLFVKDADACTARLCDAGASLVFPLQDLLGERMARVRDPFGHLWLVRQRLEALSDEQLQKQRDALFAAASAQLESKGSVRNQGRGPQDANRRAGAVHLVVGPVGAGKSTYARGLAGERRALRLTLDEWMRVLFRPDRPADGVLAWYAERAARSVDAIWLVAREQLELGGEVVLEIGLLSREQRGAFYERVDDAGAKLTVHVVEASRAVRRQRVAERNRVQGATFSMVVPDAVFELASDLWQPLLPQECRGRDVRFVRTD